MLKIDHREQGIKTCIDECQTLKNKDKIQFEQLEHADFQILDSDGTILFLFERKTIDDLLASIKDGRYKNQKAKLFESYKPSQIYYIIEGTIKYNEVSHTKDKIIQSAILNTMLRDKIGIMNTKNNKDTFECIINIFNRYIDDPSKYQIDAQTISKETIVETKSTSSKSEVFKKMLCQIPSINDKTAQTLVDTYTSLPNMINTLQQLGSNENISKTLEHLKVNNRKISKRVVEQIITCLF
jgi:ERCC4-type nuclease